jgi:excisionase family DNA binding protein
LIFIEIIYEERNMDNESELLRVSQVAKLINVSPATVYTWVEQGKFPCYKFVGAIRIRRSDLVEWCKTRKRGSELDGN